MLDVFVVSHTHWDREWYHPAERFRQRLVALVDELLDDPSADESAFLLDGQTVVLEDYLELRPERASDLSRALREGHLEAGPWFVLPDELIPGAEGLVRNLLAGRRTLRGLRAEAPHVLYCPDSFGHPAALPALARGFGFALVVLWRGAGGSAGPARDAFWWIAPSGERVLAYHLTRSGYELGANLPAAPDAAAKRWTAIHDELASRSALDAVLLLNGADHHARQAGLQDAVRALVAAAGTDVVRHATLRAFAAELELRASSHALAEIRGELRDSYGYTWTLQGTLGSRASQKRRYAIAERELLRDAEPWAAFAAFYGGASRRHLTTAAWKPLLLCQPHDTLCGCSIDQVARAMDARIDAAAAQSAGIREDALLEWAGHDRNEARANPARWAPTLIVRNPAPRARSGVAIVEIDAWIAHVPVGPASVPNAAAVTEAASSTALPATPEPAGVSSVQWLEKYTLHDRVEAPRAYPHNDSVSRTLAAIWVDDVPPYGMAGFPLTGGTGRATDRKATPATAREGSMTNGRLTVQVMRDGAVTLAQIGRRMSDLLAWESMVDVGDLYTPAIRGAKLTPRLNATRILCRGPLRAAVEQQWRLSDGTESVDIRVQLVLDAGADFLRVNVSGDNTARDHRLRLLVGTDVTGGVTVADAAFGPVRRDPIRMRENAPQMEQLLTTAPLHRYVSLFDDTCGATLFADGLTEYETFADGRIAVTLLRSVGELSRNDLPERPGHAGWPVATPAAQCPGPFSASFALMLHGSHSAAMLDEIERASDDALHPLTGHTLRSALRHVTPRSGVALHGNGLSFSAAKESDDGRWLVLRCVNLLEQEVAGAWHLGRAVREAHLARLDETPLTPLAARDDTVPFLAPPRGVVTILVR